MKLAAVCLAFSSLAAYPLLAERNETCAKPFAAPFQEGRDLEIQVRAGDIDVVGIDDAAIRVSCEVRDTDRAGDIRVEFDGARSLRVQGGPNRDVRIRIEVPRRTNLRLRCTAGDLTVMDITGNKDVGLGAGDLTINVGDPKDYSYAEASVKAGDINAPAFGVHKGGLFRSFKKSMPGGAFQLKASLGAGDIRLR